MPNTEIQNSMLQKFDGCEGGDAGNPKFPSIWLFGIEPGYSKRDDERYKAFGNPCDSGYQITTQLEMPYNRNAFKLLSIIHDYPLAQYRKFAEEHQPFVKGCQGFFKGNLYPYACNKLEKWPEDAAKETGFDNKAEYQNWCQEKRWPAIKGWIDEYQPKIFIGVGNMFRDEFSLAVFGRIVELSQTSFTINGHAKNIFCANVNGRKLAVVPHLSGGRNGLNSHKSIEQAGAIIKDLMQR